MNVPVPIDAVFINPNSCGPRTIAATVFNRRMVSTVRLTGSWREEGVEYIYETMLFNRNGEQDEAWHYLTEAAARAGHWEACLIHLQSQ